MHAIRDILRLHFETGLSRRRIARSLRISRDSVALTLERASTAGLAWPLRETWSDQELEALLYPPSATPISASVTGLAVPDWQWVHDELRSGKHTTRQLVWEEFMRDHPDGVRYSQFCLLYLTWRKQLDPVMRQTHTAGEKLFVDFAGDTIGVTDPATGEIRQAQLFVAALGCSKYTYAEATWTQSLPDWVMAHVRALEFLGGSVPLWVPDNTKTAVKRPCWYEPTLNRTYAEAAAHYGAAVLPARVKHPKDKAIVESAVLVAERAIIARLRHRTFFSLEALNEAISEAVEVLNEIPFQKLEGSRRSQFDALDRPALLPLPRDRYVYATWDTRRASLDYHVEVEKHYYSVPYTLIGRQLEVRLSALTVEVFHEHERVAAHARGSHPYRYTTLLEHMPDGHRFQAEWTPERMVRWAETVGASTARFCEELMKRKAHPAQGFRACMGVLRLAKKYGDNRADAACRRALAVGAVRYASIESILARGLDQVPLFDPAPAPALPHHEHLRGPEYFN